VFFHEKQYLERMLQFQRVAHLQQGLKPWREKEADIGFVPTMGALHEGHLSLIRESAARCGVTVCSIFVNPTQFDNTADLAKYPRTLEHDLNMLRSAGADVVFHPEVADVYPDGMDAVPVYRFGRLEEVMEGAYRPGHFAGVGQVVGRLIDIVRPSHLFMGRKDFQQVAIIADLLRQMGADTELVVCDTVREPHGLAMSSRNRRLDHSTREKAACIFEGLTWMVQNKDAFTLEELKAGFIERCSIPPFRAEYIEVVDGHTLEPLANLSDASYVVACAAVWAGEVRLIDNIVLSEVA
jgi:pantoate--beta-alanine ligase